VHKKASEGLIEHRLYYNNYIDGSKWVSIGKKNIHIGILTSIGSKGSSVRT
jgi:hypothetical protein